MMNIFKTREMAMSTNERYAWIRTMDGLCNREYLHVFYSSEQGWAYISYKGKRIRLDYKMNEYEIENKIDELLRNK